MKAVILKGDSTYKEQYIVAYIQNNQISQYNVIRFEEDLKIADAREIKKMLGSASFSGKMRVVIISSNPTPEAQNALLKTLEELEDATDVIFSGDAELLPTIISRCNVVELSPPAFEAGVFNIELIEKLFSKNESSALAAVEEIFADKKEDTLGELINSIRGLVADKIKKGETENLEVSFKLLKKLQERYSLVVFNNINPRLVVENTILNH